MTPQQLFAWRREARNALGCGDADGVPRPGSTAFAPIIVAATADQPEAAAGIAAGGGQIEIAIAGALIRLRGRFDARTLVAVLQAVRATS
jgi:hypothetical protein